MTISEILPVVDGGVSD